MKILFFKIAVCLFGNDEEGNPLPEIEKEIYMQSPAEIECYWDARYGGTMIQMKSGLQFISKMEAKEMGQLIANFYAQLAQLAHDQAVQQAAQEASKPNLYIPRIGEA